MGGRVGIRMDRWVDAVPVPVSSARIATRAKKKMEIRTGKKIKFDIPAAKLGEKSVVLASSRSRNSSNSSSSNGPAPVVESGGGTSRGNGGIRDSAPAPRPETSGRARMVRCWWCRVWRRGSWDQNRAQTLERAFGASERRHPRTLQIDYSGAGNAPVDWLRDSGPCTTFPSSTRCRKNCLP